MAEDERIPGVAHEETESLYATKEGTWIVEDSRDLDLLGGESLSIEHRVHATLWLIPTSLVEAIETPRKGAEDHRGRLQDFPGPQADQGVDLHHDGAIALRQLREAHHDDDINHIHLPHTNAVPEVETATDVARKARHHPAVDGPIPGQMIHARPALEGTELRRHLVHRRPLDLADAGHLPDRSVDQGHVLHLMGRRARILTSVG